MQSRTSKKESELLHDTPVQFKHFGEYASWQTLTLPQGYRFADVFEQSALVVVVERGEISLTAGASGHATLKSRQMVMLPQSSKFMIATEADTVMLVMSLRNVDLMRCNFFSINELIENLPVEPTVMPILRLTDVMRKYMDLIRAYMQLEIFDMNIAEVKKQEFIYLMFMEYGIEKLSDFFCPMLGEDMQFKDFVLSNYIKVKSVQEFAGLAGYSPSGFIKKFNRHFGCSPYRWMQEQRASHIRTEIQSRVHSLKDLVCKYHFSSYQHFAEFCKSRFGATPTELRQQSASQ